MQKSILLYFAVILILLLLGSLLMNGFYAITRGEKIPQVDGTDKKMGKILKGWYLFWFTERKDKKLIQYKWEHLLAMMAKIQNQVPESKIQFYSDYLLVMNPVADAADQLMKVLNIHIKIKDGDSANVKRLYVYKEETDYVYPEWLRTVLAGCLPCMSSVYGTIIFMAFHAIGGSGLYRLMYAWTPYGIVAFLSTWLSCLVMWSYLNVFFYRIANPK